METKRKIDPLKLRACSTVAAIVYILENTNDWSADTLDEIVEVLKVNGFKPRI